MSMTTVVRSLGLSSVGTSSLSSARSVRALARVIQVLTTPGSAPRVKAALNCSSRCCASAMRDLVACRLLSPTKEAWLPVARWSTVAST